MKSKIKYVAIMSTPTPAHSELVEFFKSNIKEYHDIKKRKNKTHQTTTK